MKKLIFLILALFVSFGVYSQTTNRVIVVDSLFFYSRKCIHLKDKDNGPYIVFDNGRLSCVGEYQNGMMSGIWYYFDNQETVYMELSDFCRNSDPILSSGEEYLPEFKCRVVNYSVQGVYKMIGDLYFYEEDGPELDTAFYHGLFYCYNEEGKLIETRMYYHDKLLFSERRRSLP